MPRLQGKSALITGGTTGIGLATARRFVEEGARSRSTGTDPDRLAPARETIGAGCIALRGDAGDIAGQRDIARAVGEAFGRLDAVFINAGIAELRPLENGTRRASTASLRST